MGLKLSVQERGESTPPAPRPGAGAGQKRGGRTGKMKPLLNFQAGLCETCSLPPSRLMRETALVSCQTVKRLGMIRRRKGEVKTVRRRIRSGGVEDGEGPTTTLTSR